jgi:hypothetical protein
MNPQLPQPQPTQQPNQQVGRMTLGMRSTGRSRKLLRVAMVRDGRILEERVLKKAVDVTIGRDEHCTFVLGAKRAPKRFKLFEPVAGGYQLNFTDELSGRIGLAAGVKDLAALKPLSKTGAKGVHQLRLTTDMRGTLKLGDVTFLFQFVGLPRTERHADLPLAVTRGRALLDWPTFIIGALSLMVHVLALISLYSDWTDPVVDYDISVRSPVETVKSLPPPPPIEDQKVDEQAPKETPKEKPVAKVQQPAANERTKLSAAQVAALTNELDRIEMLTLPALQGAGPITADVLQAGSLSMSSLDAAAASGASVAALGPGGLKFGSGGGALRPGELGGGLASVGSTGKTANEGSGSSVALKGPSGNATIEEQRVSGGAISDARAVVASMRPGFKACYQRGLAANPDAQGKITLTLRVGPGGEVQSASAATSGDIAAEVLDCVKQRAMAARFAPPEGGMAVVQVPVTFVRQ